MRIYLKVCVRISLIIVYCVLTIILCVHISAYLCVPLIKFLRIIKCGRFVCIIAVSKYLSMASTTMRISIFYTMFHDHSVCCLHPTENHK